MGSKYATLDSIPILLAIFEEIFSNIKCHYERILLHQLAKKLAIYPKRFKTLWLLGGGGSDPAFSGNLDDPQVPECS